MSHSVRVVFIFKPLSTVKEALWVGPLRLPYYISPELLFLYHTRHFVAKPNSCQLITWKSRKMATIFVSVELVFVQALSQFYWTASAKCKFVFQFELKHDPVSEQFQRFTLYKFSFKLICWSMSDDPNLLKQIVSHAAIRSRGWKHVCRAYIAGLGVMKQLVIADNLSVTIQM